MGAIDLGGVAAIVVEIGLRDAAGNVAASSSNPVPLDTVPPSTTVVTGPSGLTSEQTVSLILESDEPAAFTCSLDGALYEPCAASYGPLVLGPHTLQVRETDLAGNDEDPPVTVSWAVERRWRALASGRDHTCGIATDGTLWCWGANGSGQLGDGTLAASAVPVQVGNRTVWVRVATGGTHNCAIPDDGTLWCWGSNGSGELGTGNTLEARLPVAVGSTRRFAEVAVANPGNKGVSCALTGRGEGREAHRGEVFAVEVDQGGRVHSVAVRQVPVARSMQHRYGPPPGSREVRT